MKQFIYLLALLLLVSCQSEEKKVVSPKEETNLISSSNAKIISLNSTITELLYEVELGKNIVGVDRTSTYPEAAKSVANLGHVTQLNAEAILALQPTIVFIDKKNTSNEVLDQVKKAGVAVHTIDIPFTLEGALDVINQLETILKLDIDTKELEQKIAANKAKIEAIKSNHTDRPKVLFIYARGAQTLMVAGDNTFASAMIKIAGGTPAVTAFESFKPLTPEALLSSQPEVILMFDSGLKSLSNEEEQKTALEGLLEIQGIGQTPAGKNKNVIAMNGAYLSGFGPRASAAALELAQKIHKPN